MQHNFITMASLTLNICSSVGVIFINKRLVFKDAGFNFATVLTIIHFVVTFVGCLGFAKAAFFEIKPVELKRVLPIAIAFCGYVAFNNLSLLTNSVSVYQISKIMCTPVIVSVEHFYYNHQQNKETMLSLIPTCLGIFITVYTDSDVNLIGSFWAVLAIISNSFYTIWGKTKQTELGVSPMQLLTYQAPLSAAMLLPMVPFMDNWKHLSEFHMTSTAAGYILLSCVFAFGVNFSFFLGVGQTSPLTMNVVGYVKTCLVFVGGFMFFDTPMTVQNTFGIVLTMLGVALYSKAKMPKVDRSKETEGGSDGDRSPKGAERV